jgi:hypothetical protein
VHANVHEHMLVACSSETFRLQGQLACKRQLEATGKSALATLSNKDLKYLMQRLRARYKGWQARTNVY